MLMTANSKHTHTQILATFCIIYMSPLLLYLFKLKYIEKYVCMCVCAYTENVF